MTCSAKIKVYISDEFIFFPYNSVLAQPDAAGAPIYSRLTIFVPTYADEKVILKDSLRSMGFKEIRVLKYVSSFEEDENIREGVVVYWNAIVPIKLTGIGNTLVFNVVLSDNLYSCHEINIDTRMKNIQCPLQVDYNNKMVCLKGEYAGDAEEIKKAISPASTQFLVHFDKETPMGIKILNTKRFLIALSTLRQTRANVCIYLSYDELTTIHKELSWESTRRQIRGGVSNTCSIINRPSYKYILDALELLGVNKDDMSSLHRLVDIFTPLILRYKLVPNVFVELNNINGEEKHVRLYCKYEGVAITNAGPIPLNMSVQNPKPFVHRPIVPPSELFYREIGSRKAFVHAPVYNYFL
nr:unknown [Pieris rapae granulovirus]